METTTVNKKEMVNAKDAFALTKAVLNAIPVIEKFVEFNDYNLSGKIEINEDQLSGKIGELSLKKRKMLRNYIFMINNHITISKTNKFLHFLMKKVLKSDVRYRISYSDKHEAIQAKRKAYNEAKKAFEAARFAYREEKGDFYRNRIKKGQTLC